MNGIVRQQVRQKLRQKTLRRLQLGAGMLEVLVALVILSAGVLGHMRFQRVAYREVGLSAAQMTASELAAEKIDDLRAFATLPTTTGLDAFQDIATDAGGSLPAGSVSTGANTFNRGWSVVNWYYPAAGAALTTTAPAGNPLPDLKEVRVSLSWVDRNNEVQTVSLSSLIAGVDPRTAAGLYQ